MGACYWSDDAASIMQAAILIQNISAPERESAMFCCSIGS